MVPQRKTIPSFYEVWLQQAEREMVKLRIHGSASHLSALDLGGAHLTGGRIWPASILLALQAGFADKFKSLREPARPENPDLGGCGLGGLRIQRPVDSGAYGFGAHKHRNVP